jgi:hypothetical protein
MDVRRCCRFQFGLRVLIASITAIAVLLGWLDSQRRWIQERHAALEWAQLSTGCNLLSDSRRERLSLGLRFLGEEHCIEYFWIDPTRLREPDRYRIEQLRCLFPEAYIVVKSHRLPAPVGGSIK